MNGPLIEVPFQVQKDHAGSRVDSYLARRLHRYSRAQVQRLIEEGRVWLRSRPAKAATRVGAGETVLIRYPRREEPLPIYCALPVLHEDDRILAVDKPAGLLSHPTDKILLNCATSILRRQFPNQRLHLVHRLDRETSGVLILAKTRAAARELSLLFAAHEIQKEYLALVRGRIPWRNRLVSEPIGRENREIKVRQKAGDGQPAVTEFVREGAGDNFSLVRALPRTGRLHQIRVHCAFLGHPVLGDKLYQGSGQAYMKAVRRELTAGDIQDLGAPRQMLHAWRVRCPMTITAPLPEDFRRRLAECGLRALTES